MTGGRPGRVNIGYVQCKWQKSAPHPRLGFNIRKGTVKLYVKVSEQTVFHYGELPQLSPLLGRMWHYEGDTLSVSLCPREWFALFPAQPPAALYSLARIDGTAATFVDLERLSLRNRAAIDAWASTTKLGSLAAPDMIALASYFSCNIPPSEGEQAILIAWAKSLNVDGIWFSDPITASALTSSRGGIFQHRLAGFQAHSVANVPPTQAWPVCRVPSIFID